MEVEILVVKVCLEIIGVYVFVLFGELIMVIGVIGDLEGVCEFGLEGMVGVDCVVLIL